MSMLHESPFISERRVPMNRTWGWKDAGLIFLLMGMLILRCCFEWDPPVVEWVSNSAHGFWRNVAAEVSFWGDWFGVLFVGLALWFFAKVQKNTALQQLVRVMALSAVVSGLTANMIRGATGRTRPFATVVEGWYGPQYGLGFMGSGHDFQSFPSAHTALVAGFVAPLGWTLLRHRRSRVRALGAAVSLSAMGLMAWARVWCGGHHLSDVVASCILGATVGGLLLGKPRLTGSPTAQAARPDPLKQTVVRA